MKLIWLGIALIAVGLISLLLLQTGVIVFGPCAGVGAIEALLTMYIALPAGAIILLVVFILRFKFLHERLIDRLAEWRFIGLNRHSKTQSLFDSETKP